MLLGTARSLVKEDSELAGVLREVHSLQSFDDQAEVEERLQRGTLLLLVVLACLGLAGRMLRRRIYSGPTT
jgi:hypothetical protein